MSRLLKKLHKPCDKLDKYDNEPYMKNPLLKLRMNEVRELRIRSALQSKAVQRKKSICTKPVGENLDEELIPVPESVHITKLRFYSRNTPIPKMLTSTENKIINYCPKRLRDKYPDMVSEYMTEVHEMYDKIVKAYSMNLLLKPLPDDFVPPREDFQFKRLGRTENYETYLKNREKIKNRLMLPYPFISCIFYYSNTDFPNILNDFSKYRVLGEKGVHDIRDYTKKDLSENSAFIKKAWYPKIVKNFKKHYQRQQKYKLTRNQWQRALNCATGLIVRQINDLKLRTINHLNDVILHSSKIPFLKIIAICEENIDLCPTIDEIYDMYHSFIDIINDIGNNLDPLEILIDEEKFKTTKTNLKVQLEDLILKDAHERIQNSLEKTYSPIQVYLEKFQENFFGLCNDEIVEELEEYLEEPRSFEDLFEKVKEFQVYIDKLKRLVQKEYFGQAIISQSDAINSLRRIGERLIKKISDKIKGMHRQEIQTICEEYEEIKRKALEIPKSTEMLFENGEYMVNVKKTVVDYLGQRIKSTLNTMGSMLELMDMNLDREHVQLQIEAVRWYHNTDKIFEMGGSNFESYKYQFEEKLSIVSRRLQENLKDMAPNLTVINDMTDSTKFKEYDLVLKKFIDEIIVFDDYIKWINKEETLFKFPKTQSAVLEEMKSFVIPFANLMKLCIKWNRGYEVWMDGCFEYLNPSVVENTTEDFLKEFQKTQKFYRNKIKADNVDNSVCKFKGQLEDPDVEKLPAPLKICARMIQTIKDFSKGVHIVNIMCNPALRSRHWEEMSQVAGFDLEPDAGTSLRKIINFNLQCLDECEIISIGACKELQLQENLVTMIKEWDVVKFNVGLYKDTDILILQAIEEIHILLDDHLIKTLSMRGSAFVKPCEEDVKDWYNKLLRVQSTIEKWGKVQTTWLDLLPFFSSEDIVAQMPEEGKLFTEIDEINKHYMELVQQEPFIMKTAAKEGLLEAMEKSSKILERILEGVTEYLEKKRIFFPRFFFLSNAEMLEILSETSNPLKVQPHLNKCFSGIYRLELNEELEAVAMSSVENEKIKFVKKVSIEASRGCVEKWLYQVEEQMLVAIKTQTIESWKNYEKIERTEWALNGPGMVTLCVSNIFWTAEVQSNLNATNFENLKDSYDKMNNQVKELVGLMRNQGVTNIQRINIKALIVSEVHGRDVIETLIKKNSKTENDFEWLAQLRYHMVDERVMINVINVTMNYGYEYLGNSDRLVITPLTDRCYRTLIGAYQLHMNGAPEGPTATGKTETVKDLSKAFAVHCKVFNCSEGLDYTTIANFFKGLATSGSWACFDEFNRIELEVLSVVAQHILSITTARRAQLKKIIFEGSEINLNPCCFICITLNPEYSGKFELPDNLKVLFRSVAMMVPDHKMITEVSLISYGYEEAKILSVKMITVLRLCSELLSLQSHYDFGMRTIKTVLMVCGKLKILFPEENEDVLVLRSLMETNLSKLISQDIHLFEGIITDNFPGTFDAIPDYSVLRETFIEVCQSMNLQPIDNFFLKVVQTFDMVKMQHGIMLVGEPYSGKTSTYLVLAKCLGLLKERNPHDDRFYQNIAFEIINPKSVTLTQLYGSFNPTTNEWSDGIVSELFRNYANDITENRKWIIFDGPVDAVWVETMNTVLDDNKKLCLTSGEIISMTDQMTIFFEVMDLQYASPATVSRCGMVFMEPSSIGWEAFVLAWLEQCNPVWSVEYKSVIMAMLDWIIPDCLKYVKENCKQYLQPGEVNILMTTLRIFEMLLNDACEENPDEVVKFVTSWFQAAISYAVVWGIGGVLDADSRTKFDEFYREIWNTTIPIELGKIEVSVPPEGLIIDYIYIFKQKGAWKYWPDLVRNMKIETGVVVQVPTIETARYSHVFALHFKYNQPFLLVGPTGTGKTFYITNNLMKLPEDKYKIEFMTFTTQITASQVQKLIINKMSKKKKGVYGPPIGIQRTILFIDDMNTPAKDQFGSQPAIELIRQYFDQKFWYNLKGTSKVQINDLMFVAACGLMGGNRQDVYQRFLCHFNIFSINVFSEETNFKIFHTILLDIYKKNGYASDVIQNCNNIVNATLEIFNFVNTEMQATPSKTHYVFNLKDMSSIISGCAQLRKESVDTKKMFAKIWCHETLRVFFDRLVSDEDHVLAHEKMGECIKTHFKDQIEDLFDDLMGFETVLDHEKMNSLMFGNYFDSEAGETEEKKYELIPGMMQLTQLVNQCLEEYNSTHQEKLDMVLFKYALQNLNKLCRIMSLPGGSVILVGISGSGRQSITRLAAAVLKQNVYQPEVFKSYEIEDFRKDLKEALKDAGGKGRDAVFMITEAQLQKEDFLRDIDSLLNLGEVPNIFKIEEKQEIFELVRLAAQNNDRNLDIPPQQVFQYFVDRCKQKLHLVMCFTQIGPSFRHRIRLYPSLLKYCHIIWWKSSWPDDALAMVANKCIKSIDVPEEHKPSIIKICNHFHVTALELIKRYFNETGRIVYHTSTSFLELIKTYTTILKQKQIEVLANKRRYIIGLQKLEEASVAVAIMQKDLNDMQPQLIVMAEQSRKMTEQIEKESHEAEMAAEQVKRDEIVANRQAAESLALNAECEKDLASAIPILEDAIQALNTLKPADITLVKSMKNPPDTVKLVMAAVCVMKGVPPDKIADTTGKKILDYWGPSKRLLGDMQFLQNLKEYDKDNIKSDIIAKIRKEYITHKDFQPQIVAKASSAAEGLCKWVIAMDLYDAVAKIVAPKKAKLEEAKKKYEETMALLAEKRELAAALEKKVADLNVELELANMRRREVEDEVAVCKDKLMRAESLLNSMGGEKIRWISSAEELQLIYDSLPGDILKSAGIICYLGPFNFELRSECIEEWHNFCLGLHIPQSPGFSFLRIMSSEIAIQNWNICGLPRDNFSIENGIVMKNCIRYPLFIDPQNQANKWIKELERSNQICVVKFTHQNYMKKIENCVTLGIPVLIENVMEHLEASIEPILQRKIFKEDGFDCIRWGERVVRISPNFRLYLTSQLKNPHFSPEIFNKITLINFTLTLQGLEDQLLGIVVAKERPDLQEVRLDLMMNNTKYKETLKSVENDILKVLSESEGDILEDQNAVRVLDDSKRITTEVKAKQDAARKTEFELENFRQSYKHVANHSATIYYSITELPSLDPMYQFSLAWYTSIFINSIENARRSKFIVKRLKYLIDAITLNLYQKVCRSLYEKHKLLFSFMLTMKIMISNSQLTLPEIKFFINGGNKVEEAKENPDSSWIPSELWEKIIQLEQNKIFEGFSDDFKNNLEAWKAIFDDPDHPEKHELPGIWATKLTSFEKLMIFRVLRSDKLMGAIKEFIVTQMGIEFISPPLFDITKSYEDSNSLTPLIFILSNGTDPMESLLLFAKKLKFDEAFHFVSLGKSQGQLAESVIEKARKDGGWVCLQNCHLAGSWMPVLELIWENMSIYNTDSSFRLWLTSNPSLDFPSSILQNGVKMTNECPIGLQKNLLRTYNSDPLSDHVFYAGCPGKDRAFTKLLYGLSFFHAVVLERRQFGGLGWNVNYSFNDADFEISVQQLQMFLNQYDEIPYDAVEYLTGECNYGGKVTDFWDRRNLITILKSYVNDEVVSNPAYKLSEFDKIYTMPRKTEHREVVKHINETVPNEVSPEVYGLHPNAIIVKEFQASFLFLNSLNNVYSTEVSEEINYESTLLSLTTDIENKLPNSFNIEEVSEKFPFSYKETLNTVLVQEMERFNILLFEIRKTCADLKNIVKGVIISTPELDDVIKSLLDNKIPERWKRKSYPSLKTVGSYIQDFVERLNFFKDWYENGKPKSFWISGLFFTHTFLKGVLQNYARKFECTVDKLTFDFEILALDRSYEPSEHGVFVHGLFIEGANWSVVHHKLIEQTPKVIINKFPGIHLIPISISDFDEKGRYKCPLYKTSERMGTLTTSGLSSNYVMPILLNSEENPDYWIKRGVALICQSNN